jgi:polyphosphate kinase
VRKVSENIEVRSIIDRYLEHARVYCFRNGGHEEVYLSSADWMVRNLDRRLELLFPVKTGEHRRRLVAMMNAFFADNVKSRRLLSDGTWERVADDEKPFRAQEHLYQEAVESARMASRSAIRFRPLAKPQE